MLWADTVGRWLKLDKKSLALGKSGRKEGEQRLLTTEQEQKIRGLLIDKTPDQLRMAYALWTRQAVQELIRDCCDVVLAIRTVGEYLKRWGMTPQKPQKRAYEQRAPEVRAWLKEEYPAIQAQAKRENAEINWAENRDAP